VLVLAEPGQRQNVLSLDFVQTLERVLGEVQRDEGVRAVVVSCGNPSRFLPGAELRMLRDVRTQAEGESLGRAGQAVLSQLATLHKPVVAAVHGQASGGDFEVALACRARVMSDHSATVFALPEVKLGLMPPGGGLQRLADLAGLRVALDYGLTGNEMPASTARRLGVTNEVVPRVALEDVAAELALSLARRGAMANERSRRAPSSWPRRLTRTVVENPLARRVLFRRARRASRNAMGGHTHAAQRIVDVLSVHTSKGLAASEKIEARALGELLLSTAARRLIELSLAIDEVKRESGQGESAHAFTDYAARIWVPLEREAACLVTEGATLSSVEACLMDWGWSSASLAELDEVGAASAARVAIPREEIQMRCSLQLVNEALHCLGEGLVKSPRHGDVGAVLGAGFPAFRGGPFRYVDAIGAPEVLRRVEGYQSRFGQRWTPAPLLLQLAKEDGRLYR